MMSEKVQGHFPKKVINQANSKVDIDGIVKAEEAQPYRFWVEHFKTEVHGANQTVTTIANAWGGDVKDALINALTESAADRVNIEQKVQKLRMYLRP